VEWRGGDDCAGLLMLLLIALRLRKLEPLAV
jgi:hypothetical protein